MKTVLDGLCAGYLDSWWTIQPEGNPDWIDYPVEAQAAHLFAHEVAGVLAAAVKKTNSAETRHVPVCGARYRQFRPEFDEALSDAAGRADVWAPDVHTPAAPAGWFVEMKLADVRAGKPKIGRQPWAKIVDGFVSDLRKLLVHAVPSDTEAAQPGDLDARCSFVVLVKCAEGAFEALLDVEPDPDTLRGRSGKELHTASEVKKAIRDEVRGGDARQPGSERVRRFFRAAEAALKHLKGVDDVTLTASAVRVLHGHQVQVLAISWLQSVPIDRK